MAETARNLGSARAGLSRRTRTEQAWPPAAEMPLPALIPATGALPDCGEKIGGHCVLQALLGEGAFGRVFAAEDEKTGQRVALKVVSLRRYPMEYAEHELRALAAIAHPNVVQLNEHGVESNASEPYLWYTMPLYRGSDLSAALRANGNLSLSDAYAVFTRIVGGVCEMHARGLRHQDIKPDNIYLTRVTGVAEHHPVLLDLGGAARKDASSPLVATLPFAAPEQTEALIGGLLGDAHPPLTEKIDVYALAATLLFSLIGERFVGHDIAQNETHEATPAALLTLRAELSRVHLARALEPLPPDALVHVEGPARERLAEAFARWLSLDPASRPSAPELLHELGVLLEWDAERARAKAARRLRNKLLGVASGLSLAACVGGLAGYQWHKRTMGMATQATNDALRKADHAADELHRAGANLDRIVTDPTLGAVDKSRRISEVVASLEDQVVSLIAARSQLQTDRQRDLAAERRHAQQEKAAAEAAVTRAHAERDSAIRSELLSDSARWDAEQERSQARRDLAAAEYAKQKAEAALQRAEAERERLKAELSKRAEAAPPPAPADSATDASN